MADDRYRQDYSQQGRPEEGRAQPPSHYQHPPGADPPRPNEAPRGTMAASVTLPSIHDPRAAAPYGAPPHPAARGYAPDPRYASPNAVNGYPAPGAQQAPPTYLPPLQPQSDPRSPGYAPQDQRGGYYDERRPPPPPQYHEQYPQDPYYGRPPPQGPPMPPNGYPRDYRGPPPPPGVYYGQEYPPPGPGGVPATMAQAAPRQRTSIACRYCRKRKIRCSGYQSAPGGKCQNCARMNQECIFQPVSSSSSTAFVPVSAVPGGVPPGTQLFGAYGQPLAPNSVPGQYPPGSAGQGPPQPSGPYYQQPMQSPTESYSSYGEAIRDDSSQTGGRRRRRTSEEQEDGYRLPPPRAGVQEEDPRRRSPAEFSNHSSPNGLNYPPYPGARQSPRNPSLPLPSVGAGHGGSAPGGRSPVAQTNSSGASTPGRQTAAPTSQPPQSTTPSIMSLSNLVEKNDIDKTMIQRLNRPRDASTGQQNGNRKE
ncbi:hypothetical protein HJFPF1_05206 [Paramyrothecium foliicola]|nr:hypothetical protein HJFPF1_05206 [Paramyrothecium foliicola]